MQLSSLLPPLALPLDPDGHFDSGKMVNIFSALVDYFAPFLYVSSLPLPPQHPLQHRAAVQIARKVS